VLYAPHFAVEGSVWNTRLHLLNPSEDTVEVEIEVLDETGMPFYFPGADNPVIVNFGAGSSLSRDLSVLFPFADDQLFSGSLKILSTDNHLLGGGIVFRGRIGDAEYATSLPLSGRGARAAVFPHVALGLDYFTGISVLNISPGSTSFSIFLHDKAGLEVGIFDNVLQPGEKFARRISDLFPSAVGQIGGYVVVTATEPIQAALIFGNQDMDFIASVPAHPLD